MAKLKSKVSVGILKNQLSAYLKRVKVGDELIVTDHNHPVARIIPFQLPSDGLEIISAKSKPSALNRLGDFSLLNTSINSLEGLKQDRSGR